MVEPLTRDTLIKTYEGIVRNLYLKLREHIDEGKPVNPEKYAIIIWDGWASFTGCVVLTPNRNPAFKLGMLW